MFVCMVAMSWDSLSIKDIKLTNPEEDQPQRFIPVFNTKEQAEKWSLGRYQIWEVEEVN